MDQQQKLADAQKGLRPARDSRDLALFRFQESLVRSQRARAAATGPRSRLSFVPRPYPPCVVPLSELHKTMIDDLLLETHHRGTYLLVRSLMSQGREAAVKAVVEDEDGEVVVVHLHHQADDGGEPVVLEGTVMILKEPFLKVMMDGSPALRVDHPSDVVFLPADDRRVPAAWRRKSHHSGTALAWKAQGDKHLDKSEYRSAIKC